MLIRSAILNVMTRAAEKAGRALVRDFGEVEQLQVSRKGPADFVSNADRKAEKILREELLKARPDFSLLMEETGTVTGADPDRRFIIDPLDGTTNFLHGLPHWAVSVGFEERGELLAGVIYDPIKDELFWAERGKGAYVNDRRIRVSARQHLSDAVLGTGIPHLGIQEGAGKAVFTKRLEKAMNGCAGVRRFGAASLDLAYVAAGRLDGFWERGLSPWDVAAGVVIVREAGGFVLDGKGRTYGLSEPDLIATNELLQKPLVAMLKVES
ncbi:MAG: inositol monophosphatase family protein [Marivibrio sp.]|uniref:inositol monophosphatase family protein n=1 Tax=Marivibrio sp. TaxID=2039719 RepID=UPI0032EC22FE